MMGELDDNVNSAPANGELMRLLLTVPVLGDHAVRGRMCVPLSRWPFVLRRCYDAMLSSDSLTSLDSMSSMMGELDDNVNSAPANGAAPGL
jgi:hypothetical protein